MNENLNGILNVYKEAGWTSFDVVAKLRGILKTKKIGHGGTLDPSVTGVLPIAVGKSTRLLEYMEAAGKIYEGQVTIGFSTETEDADGAIVNQTPVKNNLTESEIDSAMSHFVGKIKQIPPMYSAVKINGKKLYEYARAGQTIERPAREITIKSFVRTSPIDWNKEEGLVTFSFKVECSKGTYVRTLAVDLADSLGYAGHMSKLQRTASNGLLIKDAIKLSKIEEIKESGKLSTILYPAEYAVSDLPRVNLTADQFEMARVGKKFAEDDWVTDETTDSPVIKSNKSEFLLTDLSELTRDKFAAFYDDKLIAVYMKHPEKAGIWKPNKVLV